MANVKTKDERIDVRLNRDHKEALVRAAALQGLSVSDFIVSRALEAAHEVIRKHCVITMHPDDFKRFVKALDEDSEPNEKLKRAVKRYLEAM